MRPLWHPLSTLFTVDPPALASAAVLKLLLASAGVTVVRYAGDRMWPAVGHGETIELRAPGDPTSSPVTAGSIVVAAPEGIPDLLRVDRVDGDRVELTADADPELRSATGTADLLAVTDLPRGRCGRWRRLVRRLWLDAAEAWSGCPDSAADAADTVRGKYDSQAVFYARQAAAAPVSASADPCLREIPPGTRVLVAGSGAGLECFALAGEGRTVVGVDFAPEMVRRSTEEATRLGLDVAFRHADLREVEVDPGSVDRVLFTPDVHSFVPGRAERIRLLRRMRVWLAPGGAVLLSARRVQSPWERFLLGLQWLAGRRRGDDAEFGASHTRWIAADGALHRSFVQVFTDRRLEYECRRAGYRTEPAAGGRVRLEPF